MRGKKKCVTGWKRLIWLHRSQPNRSLLTSNKQMHTLSVYPPFVWHKACACPGCGGGERHVLESPESRSANQSSSSLEGPVFFSQGWTRNTHQPSSSSKPLLPTSTVRYFPYVSARLGTQQFALTVWRTWRVIAKQQSADQLMTGQSSTSVNPG